jgi:molecular chaperone GrpE
MADIEQALQDTQEPTRTPGAKGPGGPAVGPVADAAVAHEAVADEAVAHEAVADEAVAVEEQIEGVEAKQAEGPEVKQIEEEGPEAIEVEGDLDELMQTAAQRDEYLALAQRTQADFENYRKRVARDSALAQERGVVKLAKELLPALDSLDRALEGAAQDDPLLDGVRLVRNELAAALARVGIEPFAPQGETFDPAEHEAVAQAPVEGAQSGTVAEVYQTGYRTAGGNVIRPARVLVAA